MRIVFMGTPEFAIPSLEMLVRERYEVAAVVTQPDKPKGRGKKTAMPPVKEFAIKNNIEVLQPSKVKTPEFVSTIRELRPDLLVTAAYGKILPQEVLDIPPYGCVNVHGSLLPKYRGAAPINWAIINGEKVTGITTMYTDAGMDTGDMLLKAEIEISDDMTAGELHDKLACLGAEVLRETLKKIEDSTLQRIPQPHEQATYAPMLDKTVGCINWSKSARDVHNLVRGTNPWPVAFTYYKGQKMKVWVTSVLDEENHNFTPGTILKVGKDGLVVACGVGKVVIKEVQFDSSRRMTVEEYICGHKVGEGEVLGQ
ncbi:methionyl-tRNA formyltransferase [Acetivibrio thermocellus ATCC 27405]|uniref:Methionyl-tRNA formyltransferase n=1 Tax=Acetivibrio thermocellus (strain ATCC 27405 / DSM 1237 / JCM 9322 / NBRC 103400 / NCIMB 10682 / NRRL B-4536 / VPI 7372) TaxID=203119 RepID=FMT_ACET2|nr:RecName: Full=Methionyl-tRNA formyltransferase [Acetivibrio thermocellus ATCC 27405]ABN51804.1 methionyl-tRNA formyltransferase [Acetivibrio thermocellus ATCC 27405]